MSIIQENLHCVYLGFTTPLPSDPHDFKTVHGPTWARFLEVALGKNPNFLPTKNALFCVLWSNALPNSKFDRKGLPKRDNILCWNYITDPSSTVYDWMVRGKTYVVSASTLGFSPWGDSMLYRFEKDANKALPQKVEVHMWMHHPEFREEPWIYQSDDPLEHYRPVLEVEAPPGKRPNPGIPEPGPPGPPITVIINNGDGAGPSGGGGDTIPASPITPTVPPNIDVDMPPVSNKNRRYVEFHFVG